MHIRNGKPTDFDEIKSVMNEWWGGRQVDHLQHELFFDHFTNTVFIAEDHDEKMIGFINGFYSQTDVEAAYVHFIGVSPDYRKSDVGRNLYSRFFEKCLSDDRTSVCACTSKTNEGSIRFHEKLGFTSREDSRDKIQFKKSLR